MLGPRWGTVGRGARVEVLPIQRQAVGGRALVAQLAIGDSWRIGVDESERTDLVTAGPFGVVRNPIFAAMIPTSLGLALLVPNVIALAAFLALVSALELQVRVVEEPYLARAHGERYLAYLKGRTGREMGSRALVADSKETWVCAYLPFALLRRGPQRSLRVVVGRPRGCSSDVACDPLAGVGDPGGGAGGTRGGVAK